MTEKQIVFQKACWIKAPSEAFKEEKEETVTAEGTGGEVVAGRSESEKEQLNPVFRKCFSLQKTPVRAVLRSSACGIYRIFVNGSCVSHGLLDPGFTDYEKRIQFQEKDVTDLLSEENEIRLLTAGGWALANLLGQGKHFFRDHISVIAELSLFFEDGTCEIIGSDESWECFSSFLISSSHYDGEVIDYSAEPELLGCTVADHLESNLFLQEKEPVARQERIPAEKLIITPSGKRIIDFGQNLSGFAEVRVNGKRGDRIVLRHGEALSGDGELYTKNLRTAKQQMTYILGKDGMNILHPYFSYQGFRFVLLEEYPYQADPADFTAQAIYTDMKRTGIFSCGNEKIDRLYSCILWNQRSNFIEIPTDCPQRDERLGWLGDAEVFCRSAAFNYDVYSFYRTWLKDVASEQLSDGSIRAIAPFNRNGYPFRTSAAWADAVTIIPWELYIQYGDTSCMEEMFPVMCRYVDYLHSAGPEEYLWLSGNHYGDWLALDGPDPRHPLTDKDFIASAYYAHSAELLVKCGNVLGKDVRKYKNIYSEVRKAFRERFIKEGLPTAMTEAGCALALCFGLLEEEEKPKTARKLAEICEGYKNRLMCGVVGAPLILYALSENGYEKTAFDMLLCEETPSWLGMLRFGATTLWERPDTFTEEGIKDIRNASFNHYMFGSVLSWITECAVGIKASEDGPGYRIFEWKPLPEERLGKAGIDFLSRAGRIKASWEIRGKEVIYSLKVPGGVLAGVCLPGKERMELEGGDYSFAAPL